MRLRKVKLIQGELLIQYFPLAIMLCYFLLTIILFKYGPWDWPVQNELKLYLFLLAFISSITTGYIAGSHSKPKFRGKIRQKKLDVYLLIFTIIVPLTSYSRIKRFIPSFQISHLMSNLGNNYYANNQLNNIVLIEYLRILLSPIIIAIPILILTSNKKNKLFKYFALIIFSIFSVLIDINRGQNRQIIDYIIIISLSMLINIIRSKYEVLKNVKLKLKLRRSTAKLIIIFIFLFVIFLNIFGSAMEQRNSSLVNYYAGISLDMNNDLLFLFPTDFLKITVGKLISYLTQGYYGLALALNEPFHWTYGFGYSTFLINNIDQIFNTNIISKAYYSKTIQYGWPTGITWSSAFVFFASDITYFGTIILYFIVAFGFAKSWKEAIKYRNQVSTVFFYLIFVILIYTPLNNQMFQLGENFVAFWFWFICWISYPLLQKIERKNDSQ